MRMVQSVYGGVYDCRFAYSVWPDRMGQSKGSDHMKVPNEFPCPFIKGIVVKKAEWATLLFPLWLT